MNMNMNMQMHTNSGMTLMVIATSLCNKYDEWKNNEKLMNLVDINTNSICMGLKDMYPEIDNKVIQSIGLAFSIYIYLLVTAGVAEGLHIKHRELLDVS